MSLFTTHPKFAILDIGIYFILGAFMKRFLLFSLVLALLALAGIYGSYFRIFDVIIERDMTISKFLHEEVQTKTVDYENLGPAAQKIYLAAQGLDDPQAATEIIQFTDLVYGNQKIKALNQSFNIYKNYDLHPELAKKLDIIVNYSILGKSDWGRLASGILSLTKYNPKSLLKRLITLTKDTKCIRKFSKLTHLLNRYIPFYKQKRRFHKKRLLSKDSVLTDTFESIKSGARTVKTLGVKNSMKLAKFFGYLK